TVSSAEQGITAMIEKLDVFVQENPKVVQAVASAVAGLGIFVGIVTAAKLAMIAFNVVCEMNPFVLIVSGVVAATSAIAGLILANNEATVSSETLTYAAETQSKRMEELKEKHDKAIDTYGKESYEVKQIEKEMDSLSKQISNTAQTYGELLTANAELEKSYEELKNNDNLTQLNNEADSSYNLANRLFELANQTKLTASEQAEMTAIVEHLNELFPDLGLKVEDVGTKAGVTKDALRTMLEQEYDQKKHDEAKKNYFISEDEIKKNEEYLKKLKKQKSDAKKTYEERTAEALAYNDAIFNGANVEDLEMPEFNVQGAEAAYQMDLNEEVTVDLGNGKTQVMSLNDAINATQDRIKSLKGDQEDYFNTMNEIRGITDNNTDSQKAWKNAATSAMKEVKIQLEELAKSYDKEYESAYKAITSTVGLFSDLSLKSDKTVTDMQNSLQNEYEWVNKYTENIKKAQSYGLTDGLVQSLSDGSEKSGQYINEIITQLDNMDQASAEQFVKSLNSDFKKVEKSQKGFADTVAKYKTDYTNTLNDIETEAKTTYDNLLKDMDISEESYQSGLKAMQQYLQGMRDAKNGNANSGLTSSANGILKTFGISLDDMPIEQNAKGTQHAAEVFIAGEKGPELVVNAGGSQVFTAAETQKILSGIDDNGNSYAIDLQELFKQQFSSLSLNEMSDKLSQNIISNDDNSQQTITFSPVIQFKNEGSMSQTDVNNALTISMSEFTRLMDRYNKDKNRRKFKH
ncbi:MAG: hypothetical protein ACI4RI_00265, partial [Ruminococcus sp.]